MWLQSFVWCFVTVDSKESVNYVFFLTQVIVVRVPVWYNSYPEIYSCIIIKRTTTIKCENTCGEKTLSTFTAHTLTRNQAFPVAKQTITRLFSVQHRLNFVIAKSIRHPRSQSLNSDLLQPYARLPTSTFSLRSQRTSTSSPSELSNLWLTMSRLHRFVQQIPCKSSKALCL